MHLISRNVTTCFCFAYGQDHFQFQDTASNRWGNGMVIIFIIPMLWSLVISLHILGSTFIRILFKRRYEDVPNRESQGLRTLAQYLSKSWSDQDQ